MKTFDFSKVFSPIGIYFIYILLSGLAIMAFRFFFPSQAVPLDCFSSSWKIINGLSEYLSLFPALSLSALVIPFGFIIRSTDRSSPFSPKFLQSLNSSILTAITASALYGLLFFLAIPIVQNYQTNMLSESRLYALAKEKAQESAARGDWDDTIQFIAICERIWPNGPEHSRLKVEAEIRTEEERLTSISLPDTSSASQGMPGSVPVNATEALALGETALAEERYFDAHWLATLAGQLASPGSVEVAAATRLAGRAWSGVNSLEPTSRESNSYNIYRLKREGYEALVTREWIRSYYIFLDLLTLSPEDPDVQKYFALSEEGLKQAAFFIDEIEMTLGRILSGAVYSLPLGTGRLAMRISSLSASPDTAYGIGVEIMAFDREGLDLWSMEAPFAKIVPLNLDSGPSTAILLRALDRKDKNRRWEPVIKGAGKGLPDNAEVVLPVSWDNFNLISNVRRGLSAISSSDLKRTADNLGSCGYLPQVFEAELLERFIRPLFLLPLGILAIAFGWQFRALKRPRYMAVPMLGILPAVFNGTVHFSRSLLHNLGIWAVVSFGFNRAAIFFGSGILVLFILSLIVLAAKPD
jgi:hypothetical protein